MYDVTIDRSSWIGGSDVPCIMGISPFKTRYQLLLEKAGLVENEFEGNKYTVYGQKMEPQIRDYINRKRKKKFEPNKAVSGDIRCHTDGFNGECVLEIKTTSQIYQTVDEYKVYLVQLLLYMQINGVKKGLLAVYERPDDFNPVFDEKRLQIHEIKAGEYKDLTMQINAEIDRFRSDLARLKENPLLTEQDFLPTELATLSNRVLEFENRLAEYKTIEQQYKDMKQQLFEMMEKYDVKSWRTVNNVLITRVDGTEPTVETVVEFDVDRFKEDHTDIYNDYCKTVEKKKSKRAGFVKITLPK